MTRKKLLTILAIVVVPLVVVFSYLGVNTDFFRGDFVSTGSYGAINVLEPVINDYSVVSVRDASGNTTLTVNGESVQADSHLYINVSAVPRYATETVESCKLTAMSSGADYNDTAAVGGFAPYPFAMRDGSFHALFPYTSLPAGSYSLYVNCMSSSGSLIPVLDLATSRSFTFNVEKMATGYSVPTLIESVTPDTVSVGDTVIIEGVGFNALQTLAEQRVVVAFGYNTAGIANNTYVYVVPESDNTIRAVVPSGARSGKVYIKKIGADASTYIASSDELVVTGSVDSGIYLSPAELDAVMQCSPDSAVVGSTITCAAPLASGTTVRVNSSNPLKAGVVGVPTSEWATCTVNPTNVLCYNVPVGTLPGVKNVAVAGGLFAAGAVNIDTVNVTTSPTLTLTRTPVSDAVKLLEAVPANLGSKTVVKVQFFSKRSSATAAYVQIGADEFTAPYERNWDVTVIPNDTYTLKAVMTLNDGTTVDSNIITFAVTNGTVNADPTLLSPVDGSTGVSVRPTFTWQPTSGETSYDLVYGTSSNTMTSIVSNIPGTSYTLNTDLQNGTTYYWTVLYGSDASTRYPTFSFTTIPAANVRPVTAAELAAAIVCVPNPAETSASITCSGTLPNNTTATGLTIKAGLSGTAVACTVTGTAITCPVITAPATAGTLSVYASTTGTGAITDQIVDTVSVVTRSGSGIDTTAPKVTNAGPSGTVNTATPKLVVQTDELNTLCRFSTTQSFSYDTGTLMTATTANGNVLNHEYLISTGLVNGNYTYYFRCKDLAGNISALPATTTSFTVAVSGSDSTAPVITLVSPIGNLANGTTSTELKVTTNEAAACRLGTTAAFDYNTSTNNLTASSSSVTANDFKVHTATLNNLANGVTYNYYIKCKDNAGNINATATVVTFSVGNTGTVDTTILDVTADNEVLRGEPADISIKLGNKEFIAVIANVVGNNYAKTVYFYCHDSYTASCPTKQSTKLAGPRTLSINWDTLGVNPGEYEVRVSARVDANTLYKDDNETIDVVLGSSGGGDCAKYFADMDSRSPLCSEVTYLREKGIFMGQEINGRRVANLNSSLLRSEYFAVATRLYGSAGRSVGSFESLLRFRDITPAQISNSANAWWMTAILQLDGIVKGYADGTLRPTQNITMAELAKVTALSTGYLRNYDESRNPWFADIVDAYRQDGINFTGTVTARRGDAVKLIYDTLMLRSGGRISTVRF